MGSRRVQVVERTSMLEKRFEPLRKRREKQVLVDKRNPHPLVVARDLSNGSLASLDWYLKAHKGIPDRAVAVELRKLLSGTSERSPFRIVLIAHPAGPAPKRGRRTGRSQGPTKQQIVLAQALRERSQTEPKVALAAAAVAAEQQVSPATVYRADAEVRRYEAAGVASDKRKERLNQRADEALAKLRDSSTS
jgi:hypothetical protein